MYESDGDPGGWLQFLLRSDDAAMVLSLSGGGVVLDVNVMILVF